MPSALRGLFLDSRRTFSSASSATVPACLDGTGEGLRGGLPEGSCGRRRRRVMRNRLNVGTYAPASEYEMLIRRRYGIKVRLCIYLVYDNR